MEIALIFGCARSGTSILGELLAAHPEVQYVFEAHSVWEMAGLGENDSHRLTAKHVTPEVKREIRKWFEAQRAEKALLVEKNPRNTLRVPFLREVFPEAKLVHIVRDGRDVACSMVPGCGGSEWNHLKPPSWRALQAHYRGAMRCALAWKEILEIALRDLEGVPHLQVRFEELVARPEPTARRVLEYLGLRFAPEVRAFCRRIQDTTEGSYHAAHQVQWYRPNHRRRVGRWRENLSPPEQRAIGEALAPLLRRLGYPVELSHGTVDDDAER